MQSLSVRLTYNRRRKTLQAPRNILPSCLKRREGPTNVGNRLNLLPPPHPTSLPDLRKLPVTAIALRTHRSQNSPQQPLPSASTRTDRVHI
jgi:hypothetical protein